MEDIDQKIEVVRKLNRESKIVWTIIFVFCLIMDIYAYKEATSNGLKAFLIYMFMHLLICLGHLFSNLGFPPKKETQSSKEKYYNNLIEKNCWNTDILSLIYFLPLYIGTSGVIILQYLDGSNILTWINLTAIAIWILSIFFYFKRRKYFFSEYKRINQFKYLSHF